MCHSVAIITVKWSQLRGHFRWKRGDSILCSRLSVIILAAASSITMSLASRWLMAVICNFKRPMINFTAEVENKEKKTSDPSPL